METLCMWRWYIPDLKGRLKPSRWRMTEAEAQARYPGCIKVENSLEVRVREPYRGALDGERDGDAEGAITSPM